MGIASTPTKLPLATFAKILGIHPLHFEGVDYTPDDRSPRICGGPMMQFPWQESDRVAREELAQSIAEAENMLEQQLRFHLLPSWDTEEWRMASRPYQPEFIGHTVRDIRGFATTVEAKWGYVRTGGREAKSLISLNVPINWSDEDGDGQDDTGTVTFATASTPQACEIELYYPGHDGDPEWQIRPVNVVFSGGIITATFRREIAVAEDLLFSMSAARGAVWTDDDDFLEEVDIYRHFNDPSQQAILMWDPAGGCSFCDSTGCSLCAYAVQDGCIHLRSTPKMGAIGISPGTYDADTNTFTASGIAVPRSPDIVRLNYYSGFQAQSGCVNVMDRNWARAVTYLAVTLLERPLCDCTDNVWAYWREDLARLSGGDDQTSTYSLDTRKAAGENPFGTRRGALFAWKRCTDPDVVRPSSAVLV